MSRRVSELISMSERRETSGSESAEEGNGDHASLNKE
jgi:hypothetical protein